MSFFNQEGFLLVFRQDPALRVKTFFFGLAIGVVGCYKGYHSKKGTEGVGRAANSAVVVASLLLFVIDFLAVLVADIFFEI